MTHGKAECLNFMKKKRKKIERDAFIFKRASFDATLADTRDDNTGLQKG